MRQRLFPGRERPMARRPGEGGPRLSPRARQLGGWLAALLLVIGIAAAVRLLGESEGPGPDPSPSAGAAGGTLPIEFGTELSAERLVPVEARTTTFDRDATFAYSVSEADPADSVYVEVERVGGGPAETVQAPTEAQLIPDGPALIGFSVPAADLLNAWGPGEYVMRIYLEPTDAAIAEGEFTLVEAASSP